jgi:hypothetical protein
VDPGLLLQVQMQQQTLLGSYDFSSSLVGRPKTNTFSTTTVLFWDEPSDNFISSTHNAAEGKKVRFYLQMIQQYIAIF